MNDLGFIHRFIPASDSNADAALLLLHGTGGNEEDLIPLGRKLFPGAALLSPRGKVLENGMPRFFRRLAEGIFDIEDLRRRAEELAGFIVAAREHYALQNQEMVAVGYSNGANIAAAVIFLGRAPVSKAILFRPMVPLRPEPLPDLTGMPIFMGAGRQDQIIPRENTLELAEIFRASGAEVTLKWHDGGHELGIDDVEEARRWLSHHF
jgi:phospholipase/carboxylesterase/glyoxalase family protein